MTHKKLILETPWKTDYPNLVTMDDSQRLAQHIVRRLKENHSIFQVSIFLDLLLKISTVFTIPTILNTWFAFNETDGSRLSPAASSSSWITHNILTICGELDMTGWFRYRGTPEIAGGSDPDDNPQTPLDLSMEVIHARQEVASILVFNECYRDMIVRMALFSQIHLLALTKLCESSSIMEIDEISRDLENYCRVGMKFVNNKFMRKWEGSLSPATRLHRLIFAANTIIQRLNLMKEMCHIVWFFFPPASKRGLAFGQKSWKLEIDVLNSRESQSKRNLTRRSTLKLEMMVSRLETSRP